MPDSAFPARCLPFFMERRWPTSFVECPRTGAAISFCLCGPTSAPGPQPGILDWYTILIGVLALTALVVHGALWVDYKTGGELNARARKLSSTSVVAVGSSYAGRDRRELFLAAEHR